MIVDAYLLDTVVASWLWDGGSQKHSGARLKLASLGDSPVFVSSVTIGEIEYGLGVSPSIDRARHELVRAATAEYSVLPIGRHTAEWYGQIRAALFAQYSPRDSRGRIQKKWPEDLVDVTTGKALGIQENDLWIVSVAVEYDLRFVTHDQAEGMRRVLGAASYADRTDFWIL